MLNTYTLEAYKKQNKPCFVVTINHFMRSGVYFFNTMTEAKTFIDNSKKELDIFGNLEYNADGVTDDKHIIVIKAVLSCDNIHIGKNGRTYIKKWKISGYKLPDLYIFAESFDEAIKKAREKNSNYNSGVNVTEY